MIHICYLYLSPYLFMVCVLFFKDGLRRRNIQAEAQNTLGWLEGKKDDSLSLIAALSEVPEHMVWSWLQSKNQEFLLSQSSLYYSPYFDTKSSKSYAIDVSLSCHHCYNVWSILYIVNILFKLPARPSDLHPFLLLVYNVLYMTWI